MNVPRLPDYIMPTAEVAELETWHRSAEGKAYRRRAKFEEEDEILDAFLEAIPRATGSKLKVIDKGESPDFICAWRNGRKIGVEITTVRRGEPDRAFWDSIYRHTDEMDPYDTLVEIERLISKKAKQRHNYRIERAILVVAINESDFDLAARQAASDIAISDLAASGFLQIWLVDMKSIRDGAHREAKLFGLYPKRHRHFVERSMWDQKPFG